MADAAALTATEFASALLAVVPPTASGLVLAVSGGPDSMAMMYCIARLRKERLLPPVTVGTVDHGLRAGSAGDAAMVEAQAGALGLPFRLLVWRGPKPDRAVQEKAREARYGLLHDLCAATGADHLLTAHTQDDQAETVLFRLLRGSGLTGLGGMHPATGWPGVTLARPLLAIPKARLLATCQAFAIPFVTDPANGDPRYARARLRRILPMLAAEGFGAPELARLAARLARADAALDRAAAQAFRECAAMTDAPAVILDPHRLAALPGELRLRVLRQAVLAVGSGASRLDRLERLADKVTRAISSGEPLRGTLGGARLAFVPGAALTICREGPRRRGLPHRALDPAWPPRDNAGLAGAASFSWQA